MKLQAYDLSYFVGKTFFRCDGFQNMVVYQATLDRLELKKDKGIDYVLIWKSNDVYTSKSKLLHIAFLHSIKLSEYNTGIKFDENPLAVEQNNYATKVVNACIVFDLEA